MASRDQSATGEINGFTTWPERGGYGWSAHAGPWQRVGHEKSQKKATDAATAARDALIAKYGTRG